MYTHACIRYKNKLIYSKVKEALGLDECRYFISGAAPIAKEVLEFMQSLDIPVWEVYVCIVNAQCAPA